MKAKKRNGPKRESNKVSAVMKQDSPESAERDAVRARDPLRIHSHEASSLKKSRKGKNAMKAKKRKGVKRDSDEASDVMEQDLHEDTKRETLDSDGRTGPSKVDDDAPPDEKAVQDSSEAGAEEVEQDVKVLGDAERLKRTLFVGNVSQEVTRKALKKLFKPFGKIETIRIRGVIPANPQIPKKTALLAGRLAKFSDAFFAYVVFQKDQDVEKVMATACKELNMTMFMEKHLRLSPAEHKRTGARRVSLFVGNLPFDCSEEELILAFKPVAEGADVKIVNAAVNRDRDTGVGRGVGFVTFNDHLGLQACLNCAGEIKIRERVVRMEIASKMKKMNTTSYRRYKYFHEKRTGRKLNSGAASVQHSK